MSSPRLYHLTLRPPDAVADAVVFPVDEVNEVVLVARSEFLEVLAVRDEELVVLTRLNLFETIRALDCAASTRIFAATDQGLLHEVTFDHRTSQLSILETLDVGMSGLRAFALGEYLVVDPLGRAIFLNAIEDKRAVIPLNSAKPELVYANRAMTVCYSMTSASTSENPGVLCLERIAFESMSLSAYEFNSGLNLVVRSWSCEMPSKSNFVLSLHEYALVFTNSEVILVVQGSVIDRLEASIVYAEYVKVGFVLAQNTRKEWLKIIVENEKLRMCNSNLRTPLARKVCVLKIGYVCVFPQTGDTVVAQISNLEPLEAEIIVSESNLSPLLGARCWDHELLCLSGYGSESQLKTYFPFLPATELADTPLPEPAQDIFSCKRLIGDSGHTLIVLAFKNHTTALTVTDAGVEEAGEAVTMLAESVRTIGVAFVLTGVCQVHERGLRHVSNGKVSSWSAPNHALITGCAFSPSQVAVSLDSGYVIYFEARENGLVESQQRIPVRAQTVTFGFIESHELRSSELLVGSETAVRVYSTANLKQLRLLAFRDEVYSLVVTRYALYAGHAKGVVSVAIDGEQQRFHLGIKQVKLVPFEGSVLALSDRVSLVDGFTIRPLAQMFHGCSTFLSDEAKHAVAAVSDTGLQLFTLDTSPGRECGVLANAGIEVSSTLRAQLRLTDRRQLSVAQEEVVSFGNKVVHHDIHTGAAVRLENQDYVAIASNKELTLYTPSLDLVHTTTMSSKICVVAAFKDMVLVALQKEVMLFSLGKKQLLRQAHIKLEVACIKSATHSGNFVYIGDSQTSVHVLEYAEAQLVEVASDFVRRGAQTILLLDPATVCIGDRFGNIAVLRCLRVAEPLASAYANQLELLCAIRVNDAITSLNRGALISKNSRLASILYTGVSGRVGALHALATNDEYNCLKQAEKWMAKTIKNHVAFRTGTCPTKHVVDGDLCEKYLSDSCTTQCAAALEEIGVTKTELQARIGSIRCLL